VSAHFQIGSDFAAGRATTTARKEIDLVVTLSLDSSGGRRRSAGGGRAADAVSAALIAACAPSAAERLRDEISLPLARERGAQSERNLDGRSARMELTTLSSNELLATLDVAWTAGNRALAQLLAYLGEVERRDLHREMACTSMFAFLERRFGLTGGSAYRRLTAARLVRRFPTVLGRIEQGDIHLEALCALKDVLTEGNVDDLMAATAKKTLREIESVVACLAPRPDAPSSIRKLPEPRQVAAPAQTPAATQTPAKASSTLAVDAGPSPTPPQPSAPQPTPPPRPRVEQLSAARHKVQVTISTETRAKIDRARDLLSHSNPTGDLEVLFDRAMDALLEKLEKERLARTSRPQQSPRPSKPGHIPAEVRREVLARDGEQCTHVDATGHRCTTRAFLQLDHVVPRARRGTDEPSNLRVLCGPHNRMAAEQLFGTAYVTDRIEARRKGTPGRPP